MSRLTSTIRRCFNAFGVDIHRYKDAPDLTLLGIPFLPIRTVIDVGANHGQFTRRFLKIFPEAVFHCYEPLPHLCAELHALAEAHPRIHVHQVALGECAGSALFRQHLDHSASSSLLATTRRATALYPQTARQEEVEVPVSTLDAQLSKPDLREQVLLKLDVQGYEDRVLRGGRSMLESVHVVITEISIESLYERQASFIAICRELDSAGLSYAGNLEQVYGERGEVIFVDALFVRRNGDAQEGMSGVLPHGGPPPAPKGVVS